MTIGTVKGKIWVSPYNDMLRPNTWEYLPTGEKDVITTPMLLVKSWTTTKTCVCEGPVELVGPILWARAPVESVQKAVQIVNTYEAFSNARRPKRLTVKISVLWSAYVTAVIAVWLAGGPVWVFGLIAAIIFMVISGVFVHRDREMPLTDIEAVPTGILDAKFVDAKRDPDGDGWVPCYGDSDSDSDGGDGGD